jgi:site-specific recombinase XerD
MSRKDELYPHLRKGLDRAKLRIANSEIMEGNKKSLLDFLVKLEADGTGKPQIISYIDRLKPIAELIGDKPFKEVTKREMETVFAEYRKKGLSKSSMNKTVECLKAFYRWVHDLSSQDPAPEVVRWLKRENVPNGLRPEDLWSDSDMEKVMNSTRSLKDKCIMSVLFEAGLRPGELRGLRIKDVVVKKDMVNLYVAGKTERVGGERVVPLLRSYNVMRMAKPASEQGQARFLACPFLSPRPSGF